MKHVPGNDTSAVADAIAVTDEDAVAVADGKALKEALVSWSYCARDLARGKSALHRPVATSVVHGRENIVTKGMKHGSSRVLDNRKLPYLVGYGVAPNTWDPAQVSDAWNPTLGASSVTNHLRSAPTLSEQSDVDTYAPTQSVLTGNPVDLSHQNGVKSAAILQSEQATLQMDQSVDMVCNAENFSASSVQREQPVLQSTVV